MFAGDTAIKTLADPTGQITHWSEFDSGGHFPAMETPELLVDDLRTFFASIGKDSDCLARCCKSR